MLYCVTKKKHILLISPLICSFFFLSNENSCHRFLSSFWSQCFKILWTTSGRQSVLCKWKLRCSSSFCLFFHFFSFSFFHSYIMHLDIFSVKDFSTTTWVRILKFGIKLDSDKLHCVTKKNHILLISLFIYSFSFSPMKFSVEDFLVSIRASVFKFCVHLQVG